MTEKVDFTPVKLDEDAALNPQDERKARKRPNIDIAVTIEVVVLLVAVAFIVGYFARRTVCKEHHTDHDNANDDHEQESRHEEAIKGINIE